MVTYLLRSAWGARTPTSVTPLTLANVEGVAIHWPGMQSPVGRDRVDEALRGWQDYHMDGRGWSDIAYQVAVDQWGRAWTLRGLTTRSAANGDADVNQRFGAILLVLAPGEQPSEAMKATTREVIADFRRHYPKATRIVPHSLIRPEPTDCPGDPARAAINSGDFNPTTPPPAQEDDMTPQQADRMIALLEELTAQGRTMAVRMGDITNRQFPSLRADVDREADKVAGPDDGDQP